MASSRRQYPFHLIEPKWQQAWAQQQTFRAWNPGEVLAGDHPFAIRHGANSMSAEMVAGRQAPPKFYILDMFPYPSGAGLHVGHPEGYTATDILARYRRAAGFNVLHPMGWDSFGLPAEQYAVKTGQHPRKTTEANIANFTRQIKSLGFSYDWSREIATTDVEYFRWTQWIFLQLYNSWFNPETNKAEPMATLKYPEALCVEPLNRGIVEPGGAATVQPLNDSTNLESARRAYRDARRLAYVSEAPVNWCPELGTVLANEEVIDGKSEVGGFPVIRRPMRQWMLRITAYAEKLLADLDTIDWSASLKEMQRNWIGRSEGAEVRFKVERVQGSGSETSILEPETFIAVFTTRPDTLFGATYMVLSPEHKLVGEITTAKQKSAVEDYRKFAAGKSDLERTELAKEKSGVFTGAYAVNPVNGEKIPIWIADYVLASYGTGAIMAVPAHDERDFEFAKKFSLPIVQVVGSAPAPGAISRALAGNTGDVNISNAPGKSARHTAADVASAAAPEAGALPFTDDGVAVNSGFITGLPTAEAKTKITAWLEEKGLGKKTINYKLRDWLFSRQRYWGEPFPIVWKKDAAGNLFHEALPESSLPLLPPALEDYKPTADGQPPLARATDWVNLKNGAQRETNTMPQWAGSCWYYLRYLAPRDLRRFTDRLAESYWMGGERPAGTRLLHSPEEWSAAVDRLVHLAFVDGKRPPYVVEFAPVSEALAAQIRRSADLEVDGFNHSLDVFATRHIFNEHGIPAFEAARGNLAVTREDLKQLPEILAAPDSVEFSARAPRGFKRLVIRKRINGFVFVVEEVRGKNRQLQVVTLYKNATARDVTSKAPLSDTSNNAPSLVQSKPCPVEKVKATPGVDLYVGGTEHAVLHLLYARFWHKVMFDLGHVSTAEPFYKLVNQGLILGEDGQKMSKSRGNVVNPDDILVEYGADAFRLYEMFMGPLQDSKPWSTKGVEGGYRFLGRVWRLFVDEKSETNFEQAEACSVEPVARPIDAQRQPCNIELLDHILLDGGITDAAATPAQLKALHACIKKVTEDLEGMRFNTAISAMMVFINEAMTWQNKPFAVLKPFLQLLAPFAPHLAEELWARLHSTFGQLAPSLTYAPWPQFDPTLLVESEIELPVQVNGKFRDTITVAADADHATIETAAKASEKVQLFIAGKAIKKVIIVPRRMVNLIAG